VIEPHEYAMFPTWFADPTIRKRIAWSYIDARDLGQICKLAIEKDGLGFQVFNAANDTTSANTPTADLLRDHFPNVSVSRELGTYESLLSNRKIRDVLGFREEHDWRKYVKQSG
jgi:nucleoside-diphosphate-sugar epimerase